MKFWKQLASDPIFPYFAPFFLFGFFLWLESLDPRAVYIVYPIKTFCVGMVLVLLWRRFPEFGPLTKPIIWQSAAIGAIACVIWVGLDFVLIKRTTEELSKGFNPLLFKDSGWGWEMVAGLAAFRILGATIVVPIMEELFWRGFLMRFLIPETQKDVINDNFEKVPMGTYGFFSFAVTTVAFACVHGVQWPLGLAVGVLYGWWFIRTKSLGAVMIAHGVTNLLLGVYVLVSQRWYFW
ncbi:MAG: CAAX prenyl protease-related protein [Verrucomicrobia bacterium Tous-C9LFEB]|nr:MAG: CAAX prenyl protease-related protein [Verrucomicrobia bacterium Tous-C9LFEB]